MGSRRWGGMAVVAVTATALLTTSCARVPTGGEAVSVRDVPPVAVDDFPDVALRPLPPSRGDSPEDIVRGFLSAVKSTADRHAIARSYLAAPAEGWTDNQATQIVSVAGLKSSAAPDGTFRVNVTGQQEATLEKDGAYVPQNRQLNVDFTLRRVNGEWRISKRPPGVLLPVEDFREVYRQFDLFFLSPDGGTVVPDRRYFDVKAATLPTRLAQALLAGASDWLSPGVRTAFPDGTRLRSNVTKEGDLFVVDLTSDVLAASRSDQAALAAQLVWTLVKSFSVAGLRLLADGRPLRVQNGNGLLNRDAFDGYDPRAASPQVAAYFLTRGSLRAYAGTAPTSTATAAGAGLISAAMSADEKRLAGIRPKRGGGMELVAGPIDNPMVVRYAARTLSRPSWEAGSAAVYVIADGHQVVRVPIGGRAAGVPAKELAGAGPVSALVLSRDGVRVAVIAGRPGDGQLLVGVLARSPGQLSITGLRRVAPELTGVLDVAWSGEAEMLVLGRLGGAPAAHDVDVDGANVREGTTTGLPSDRRHVASAPGQPDLVEAGGQIWQRSRSGWGPPPYEQVPRGSAPFYAGG